MPAKLYFDDEDINELLYGPNSPEPTPVTPFQEKLAAMNSAFRNQNMEKFIKETVDLFIANKILPDFVYIKTSIYLKTIIPDKVKPKLPPDLKKLKPVIDRFYEYSIEKQNFKHTSLIHRFYEFSGHYDKGIRILEARLLDAKKKKQMGEVAITMNNLAYIMAFFKGQMNAASPIFRKAALLFYENNDRFNYINGMLNHLLCEIENVERDIEEIQNEMFAVISEMGFPQFEAACEYWQFRKYYILRAKYHERKSEYHKAIFYVKRIIKVLRNADTVLLDEDLSYRGDLILRSNNQMN
ncbi:MAG: hypothetical protein K9I94_00265 [Bacteroidales bacterium]|nr:hypothetical protein [Bacteroidales bacterium]